MVSQYELTRSQVTILQGVSSYLIDAWQYSHWTDNLRPVDRTSELRKKGYEGRRLGPVQMTTDTAVRVTRICVQDKSMFR